jgi:hypothetical protein
MEIFLVRTPPPYHGWLTRRSLAAPWRRALCLSGALEYRSSMLERAQHSLEGLSVGDAFGEQFIESGGDLYALMIERALPESPWHFTALVLEHTPASETRDMIIQVVCATGVDAIPAAWRKAREPLPAIAA